MAVVLRKLELVDGRTPRAGAEEADCDGPRLRVAIASQSGRALDAHFGYARRLMVYDVTRRSHRLVQAIACAPEERDERAENEDTIAPKVAALAGCDVLFVLAIGPPAAAKVIGANIHPIKIGAPEGIDAVIERVQIMMSGEPPPWLQKILGESRRPMKGPKERPHP
ncbi:MAG TPA: nitrogen fixation protein NifX [Polyangiaceae bacterium]|nr:nitrogen fixation protein NifX [Polyangiaceae bacterium]